MTCAIFSIILGCITGTAVIGEDYPPVRQPCVLIYTHAKEFRCDRLFSGGFQ